jgi:hypothetical protein
MESSSTGAHDGANEVRQRLPQQPAKPQQADSTEAAKATVTELNEDESKADKDDKEKRTYGRTPSGVGMTCELVFEYGYRNLRLPSIHCPRNS